MKTQSGDVFLGEPVEVHPEVDLALVRVRGAGLTPLRLGNQTNIQVAKTRMRSASRWV